MPVSLAAGVSLDIANTWTKTQTISPAVNTSALVVSGFSLTGSNAQSLVSLAGTWNTTGTPTAIDLNVTDTASNAASLLLDLRVGGASKFAFRKDGALTVSNHVGAPSGSVLYLFANGYSFGGDLRVGAASDLQIKAAGSFSWSADTTTFGTRDLLLYRDAAGILAQRNGANAQTFRWYYTFTDLTNRQNGALRTAADYVEVAAETAGSGADNIDVLLTPAGTGNVRFGTHDVVGIQTVTGYITIKDAAGTPRNIAVVS